jgi:hypothetical protein
MSVAGQLRQLGKRVVQQTLANSGQGLITAATSAGLAVGADTVVVVDVDGSKRDEVLVVRPTARHHAERGNGDVRATKQTMALTDLIARILRSRAKTERAR